MFRNPINEGYLHKEGIFVLTYVVIYLVLITAFPVIKSANWLALVFIPLLFIFVNQRKNSIRYTLKLSLATFGIKKYNLTKGLLVSSALGLIISVIIFLICVNTYRFQFSSINLQTFYLLPLAFLFIFITTAFVEEFFFRAVLQSRLSRLLKNSTSSVILTAILFGTYHITYYFFNNSLFQYSYTHVTLVNSFSYGLIVGLVSGIIYEKSDENLLASVLFNGLCCLLVTAVYFQEYFF